MANTNLHKAKRAKNDEFYTRREDIEAELQHYNEHFKDKVVYCNCDDPAESEFVRYFCRVFRPLGLKKLIATHYDYNEQNYTYSLELDADDDTLPEVITPDCMTKTPLDCNGDFRHARCIDLLKQADIVVTNPPFSLFREYVAQLIEYDKKFIIIGNMNAITYKEFFPLLMHDKVWSGYKSFSGGMNMIVPDHLFDATKVKKYFIDAENHKIVNIMGVIWFTNCDIPKRHEPIDLTGNYYDPEVNPKYDNYDAIEVSKVAEIPIDYEPGYLVPVSYRPQLEAAGFILGHERDNAIGERCVCVCGRRHAGVESGHDTDGVVQWDNGCTDNVHEPVCRESVSDNGCDGERGQGVQQWIVDWDDSSSVSELEASIQEALHTQDSFEYCSGVMGLPITFMNSYAPAQFDIVGGDGYEGFRPIRTYGHKTKVVDGVRKKSLTGTLGCCIRKDSFGKGTYFDVGYPVVSTYKRIFIRKKVS